VIYITSRSQNKSYSRVRVEKIISASLYHSYPQPSSAIYYPVYLIVKVPGSQELRAEATELARNCELS